MKWRIPVLLLVSILGPTGPASAAPLPLQVFSNAVLVADHPANDGDSFLVQAGGVRHHLRLYFADCPESRATQDADFKRVREQRRFFGLPAEDKVIAYGKQASDFTRKALAKPFVFYTAFTSAMGRSQDKRFYAFVRTADGQDLAELLVRQGLARAYGMGKETPEGRPQDDFKAWLADLEAAAMMKRRGIWADSDPDQIAALRAERRREEREVDDIKEALKEAASTEPVKINTGSMEELDRLPNVGKKTAQLILDGRPWKSWAALEKTDGIGPANVKRWRELAVLE